MKPSTALLPALLLGLAIPSLAQADVPPGPDYVESCTVEAQGAGMECVLCGDAYHGDREACEKKHAPGLERRCRTSGASVWKEVWCKKSAAAPPVAPPEAGDAKAKAAPPTETKESKDIPPKGGCSVVATGADGLAGAGWLFAVLGLGLAGSRPRPRR